MLDPAFQVAPDLVAISTGSGAASADAIATLQHEGKVLAIVPLAAATVVEKRNALPVLRHAETGELAIATGRFSVRLSENADRSVLKDALGQIGYDVIRDHGTVGAVQMRPQLQKQPADSVNDLQMQPGISKAEPEILRTRTSR